MADSKRQSIPRVIPPLRPDSAAMVRWGAELSPSRSSGQSCQAHSPSSSVPSTPLFSARPASPEKRLQHPGGSNAFLTALATQERRVFELKEELQKAEVELEELKKQWAAHEATKKRNELRNLEQLKPLNTSLAGPRVSQDDDLTRLNKELDRRKCTSTSVKSSQRTVFSGSRHTRTLSLLSPRDRATSSQAPLHGNGHSRRPLDTLNDIAVPSTVQELSSSTDGSIASNSLHKGPPRDMILETGKQLVGDFRQGLWTFFEDLKQVTVGDEAANTSDIRTQPRLPFGNLQKKQAPKERGSTVKQGLVGEGHASGDKHNSDISQGGQVIPSDGVTTRPPAERKEPAARPTSMIETGHARSKMNNSCSDSDDDGWDNWDTPPAKGLSPRWKDPFLITNPVESPLTDRSSSRTSMSSLDATPRPNKPATFGEMQDDIPWPALKKLSPSRLSRTASTLMTEWEKGLPPPPSDGAVFSLKVTSKGQKAD